MLGCLSWSERGAPRAPCLPGSRPGVASPAARDQLTGAQELQIAQLGSAGALRNREMRQRLYVSHRTISTHLYRIFPKLGITARSELGAALLRAPCP